VPDRAIPPARQFTFGPFRLIRAQHLLLMDDKPVHLGGRALDILSALLERPGEVVGKEELIARVWPNVFVDEANLRVHVAALRKALGDGQAGARYISNVAGRGYCFVATVLEDRAPTSTRIAAAPFGRTQTVPPPDPRMVGRAEVVRALAAQLPAHRFVTLVGPGGIGKTTVALAVADAFIGQLRDGVHFIDLAPLSDPLLVPTALASALDLSVRSDSPIAGIVSFLRDREMLIVLDNCEHVIDAAAVLAESVLRDAACVLILATSREPLGIDGEHLHRLSPLHSPPESAGLTATDALGFPAVQLFVERAAARLDSYRLTDDDAPFVADICRRLDGIALAIEIAAGRVDAFGVAGLASLLDDRFRLLMRGSTTSPARQLTLGMTLDWSYTLLLPLERTALRRLAIFAGVFTIDGVTAVLGEDGVPAEELVECVASLVDKSLVVANVAGEIAEYRLLDTTRAYAREKLKENREDETFARRHARHFRDLLAEAASAWERQPATEWLEKHRHLIDDVRAALDWSFSPSGDASIGISLAIGAVPLWFQASLLNECHERAQQAISRLAPGEGQADVMRLYAAIAWSLMQTKGQVAETQGAWAKVLELSEALNDLDYQARGLWGLWSGRLNSGDFKQALVLAERFCAIAPQQRDPGDRFVGDRMIGYTLHLMGQQTAARQHIERMLNGYETPVTGAQIIRFVFDQRLTARCFLARILWLQGFPDQAMATVAEIIEYAASGQDTLSLCQALVQCACPVALLVGDLQAAERYATVLVDAASANALEFWKAWGGCFRGVVSVRRGDVAAGLTLLENALRELRAIEFGVYYVATLCEFADALGLAGDCDRGLEAIGEALDRCERNEERWCFAELLRIKAELLLRRGATKAAEEAERHLSQSLEWARRQQAWSWELRSAVSLARLWDSQGRAADAAEMLRRAIARFTEGLDTRDLKAATALLEQLR
jgi:predicted ATPase/DNA-binding winged helix-turn-helix (wHTH) protein